FITDDHVDREQFLMVGSALTGYLVISSSQVSRLKQFLERGLEIGYLMSRVTHIFDLRFEKTSYHATRIFNSAVEINCSNNGFKPIDKKSLLAPASGLFFPFAQFQIFAKPYLLCI